MPSTTFQPLKPAGKGKLTLQHRRVNVVITRQTTPCTASSTHDSEPFRRGKHPPTTRRQGKRTTLTPEQSRADIIQGQVADGSIRVWERKRNPSTSRKKCSSAVADSEFTLRRHRANQTATNVDIVARIIIHVSQHILHENQTSNTLSTKH